MLFVKIQLLSIYSEFIELSMNQIINKTLAFVFIWVFGLGVTTYIIFQIDQTDFSYLSQEASLSQSQ